MKINFTEKDFEYLQKVIKTGQLNGDDGCGEITIGGVCCELVIRDGADNAPFSYGDRHIGLDANFYLLGKDTGYGEVNGIPYSYISGFYAEIKGTYIETLTNLIREIYGHINTDPELKEGVVTNTYTWENDSRAKLKLFGYDIYDGDKGIITAPDEDVAIKIFQCEYMGTPIVGVDTPDYNSKTCQIDEIGVLYHEAKLYFLHD